MPELFCHPDTPATAIRKMAAEAVFKTGERLELRWMLEGDIARIHLPAPAPAVHTDGLWKSTCFECFILAPDSGGYEEYNFSPSGAFAAYRFSAYRAGMQNLPLATPTLYLQQEADRLVFTASFTASAAAQMALTAVIEETSGHKSYWSLRHPAGKPDFHHPDNFIRLTP